MSALKEILESYAPGEFCSYFQDIKKAKAELAALEAVAEAAREWRRLWIDASDEIEERTGCDCEVCNLMRAVDALKKESK